MSHDDGTDVPNDDAETDDGNDRFEEMMSRLSEDLKRGPRTVDITHEGEHHTTFKLVYPDELNE